MGQIAKLVQVAGMVPASGVLDLGCGNGMITEYLSGISGAHINGLDYIPTAIAQAAKRTQAKRDRLEFVVGDLTQPDLLPGTFDVLLSIDTIYFSRDYVDTLRRWHALLRSGGQMALMYSHGVDPEHPKETFRRETLPPDQTPLADALKQCGLEFQTEDFTGQDDVLARRKIEILATLKSEFEAEGNLFLYKNRMNEAVGVASAIAVGMHARYLYRVPA